MFEEFEKNEKKSTSEEKTGLANLFDTEISNTQIGTRIKKICKIMFKITLVLNIIATVIFMLLGLIYVEDTDGASLLLLVGVPIIAFIATLGSYYGYLLSAGFASLIEDVSEIRKKK